MSQTTPPSSLSASTLLLLHRTKPVTLVVCWQLVPVIAGNLNVFLLLQRRVQRQRRLIPFVVATVNTIFAFSLPRLFPVLSFIRGVRLCQLRDHLRLCNAATPCLAWLTLQLTPNMTPRHLECRSSGSTSLSLSNVCQSLWNITHARKAKVHIIIILTRWLMCKNSSHEGNQSAFCHPVFICYNVCWYCEFLKKKLWFVWFVLDIWTAKW